MTQSAVTVGVMTVGAYLRDLPPDRRVAMARVCSMIRRSARGVRESMRYGLAFYELDGPLFALASGRRSMSLYVAEPEVVIKHKDALPGANPTKSHIKFSDLNRLPLDIVEKIVRDSVTARRNRVAAGALMSLSDLLKLWDIKEEATATTTIITKPGVPAPVEVTVSAKKAAKLPKPPVPNASGPKLPKAPKVLRVAGSRLVVAKSPAAKSKAAAPKAAAPKVAAPKPAQKAVAKKVVAKKAAVKKAVKPVVKKATTKAVKKSASRK